LDFLYADTDSYTNEIAELYSYTEQSEFQLNVKVSYIVNFLNYYYPILIFYANIRTRVCPDLNFYVSKVTCCQLDDRRSTKYQVTCNIM
jgi:hypothetical protein